MTRRARRRAAAWAGLRLLVAAILVAAGTAQASAGGLTPEALWGVTRLSDPQPSPDGSQVAYAARDYSIERNGSTSRLWLIAADGGAPRPLTLGEVKDSSPRWATPNLLLFLSSRGGSSQIWAIRTDGGEAWQVSDLPLDVANLAVAPGGTSVSFTLEVFPDCEDLDCTANRVKEQEASPVQARVYTELLYRHWDSWEDGRRSHLFVAPLVAASGGKPGAAPGGGSLRLGTPRDLMAGMDADSPTRPFGGGEEIAFSPDGRELIFAAKDLPGSEPSWRTDVDLFRVPADGTAAPRKVTTQNRAWDTMPAYSPDGKWLAYVAMERPGFEADRFQVVLRPRDARGDLGPPQRITSGWDRSVGSLAWLPDSRGLVVTAQEHGRLRIFTVAVPGGGVKPLVSEHHNTSVAVGPKGRVFFLQDSLTSPADLFVIEARGGAARRLTSANAARLAGVEMGAVEDFWFQGARGEKVHGWLVKPPGFSAGRRYPLAFLIHGGPQGAWQDAFHYRWNPQIYAGAGYVAVAINFHGSTGYGQAFTDSITGDWGGAPFQDLMMGLDHILASQPAVDRNRMCALGASYGGYMINWVAGHTDRFRCLVNHDGLFDLSSMYHTTEELWFPEWEFGGTPWDKPELYERWNPAAYVKNWKTPMLVIHGALDYRVPETEAFATFTALRRRGVEARLLHFPDENHWVLKPANALKWHAEVLDWMARWTSNAPPRGSGSR